MSNHVSVKGKDLGVFTLDPNTRKTVFVAKNIDTLVELFSLKPIDIVEVECLPNMSFQEFVEKELKDVSAYYPNQEAFFLKNYREKTIDEYNKNHG